MAKKHDENKDLRCVARLCKVNPGDRTIRANKAQVLGIRTLGRIDYLTNYCGWHFVWDNSAGIGVKKIDDNTDSARAAKKAKKEPKLTDKTRKGKKK